MLEFVNVDFPTNFLPKARTNIGVNIINGPERPSLIATSVPSLKFKSLKCKHFFLSSSDGFWKVSLAFKTLKVASTLSLSIPLIRPSPVRGAVMPAVS